MVKKTINKAIVFDMDGTIADLYGVPDWWPAIDKEDVSPFNLAKPMLDMWKLSNELLHLQRQGYLIGVISWLPKNASEKYAKRVECAKRHWLKENLFLYPDEIKILPYGADKRENANHEGILFDDEAPNRKAWGERAYTPNEIFTILNSLR